MNAIYSATQTACQKRGWPDVDLLIIGGDFQAVRNANDLTVMSCPVKYREIGDFHEYYSGKRSAPFLTLFVGGNHEATSYLRELYYGGWVAPNIYYMGAANVVRLGPLRIAGMSGIWKGMDYNKTHYERLPYNQGDIKTAYHVREIDVRKLLQIRTQVDIGISHDWPRGVENHGNEAALWRMKPDFQQESRDGTLGNPAATYVMDRLRPPYWFAAHLHCKYAAIKTYQEDMTSKAEAVTEVEHARKDESGMVSQHAKMEGTNGTLHNADEIDLDLDDDDDDDDDKKTPLALVDKPKLDANTANDSAVPDDIRALLPASFTRPPPRERKATPGQPVPSGITNKTVRFLALDKCLPGRKFLQLLDVKSEDVPDPRKKELSNASPRWRFQYDPEWLAITRVFAPLTIHGDRNARHPPDIGETSYLPLIQKEEAWINENVLESDKLDIPHLFEMTAPIHEDGMPEIVDTQPQEYSNAQTQAFCTLIGIDNALLASEEERAARQLAGPAPEQFDANRGFRGGRGNGRGRGRGSGRSGRGGGRGGPRGWRGGRGGG